MKKETKSDQLISLQAEITATFTNPWLFPAIEPVQGFLGAGQIMFVGERPSTGKFNGPSARLLYSLLEKYGVSDAHLTDVIKTRGKAGEPYPEDMALHRRIFDREVEIVEPNLIIAFGPKVYDLLQFSLAGSGIKIRTVWHYSYTRRGNNKQDAFDEQVKNALTII